MWILGGPSREDPRACRHLTRPKPDSSLFDGMEGSSVSYRPLISIAPPEPHRSTLDPDRGYYGEAPAQAAGRSGAWLEEQGARSSTVWGAKLGSDGSPRRGRRVKGQSRGTAGRIIHQASPVTLPSERAKNRVLLSKGLEINDLCSSLRETVPSFWTEGELIIMSA